MFGLFNYKHRIKNNQNEALENIKMIAVPDIRAYMLKGYEEIRQVKEDRDKLKNELAEAKQNAEKFEQLYNAQLVVSQEFESRCNQLDKQLDWERTKRADENEKRQADINLNLQRIDKLKEEKYILEEKLNNLETYRLEEIKQSIKDYSNELIYEIKNTKGRLSKDIVIDLICKKL